jgi:zinc transporter ZupT
VLASLAAAAVSTAGLLSMAALGDWGKRHSAYFSAFAIGVMLVAVLFHLTPEALSFTKSAWRSIVGGFAIMLALGYGLRLLSHTSRKEHGVAIGYASIVALGFHSFVDGLIYEATYHAEFFTGSIATAGLLLHEFPEGVIAYFLVRDAGLDKIRSTVWAFIAASLTTVAGAVIASAFIENVNALPLGSLLGLTAGGLIYIMVFHLGPHASLTPKKRGYMVASIGVVVALCALVFRHM